jgi:hypothetical protein
MLVLMGARDSKERVSEMGSTKASLVQRTVRVERDVVEERKRDDCFGATKREREREKGCVCA